MRMRVGIFEMIAGWAMPTVVPADEGAGREAASEYPDSELKSFASAALKVRNITDAYTTRMVQAKTAGEKKLLEQQAVGALVNAVKTEGLSLDRYQAIAKQVESDAELAERVRQKIHRAA